MDQGDEATTMDQLDQDQASNNLLRQLHGEPEDEMENDDEHTPQKYTRGAPRSPATDTPSKFEFNSHYVPLQGRDNKATWKQELAKYHQSYLTPPKMSPGRSTDKIVRCITTRAFGCERPIKEGEKPRPPPEIVNRTPIQTPTKKQDSPEENWTPSRIREMFEKSTKEPAESPIPNDKPPRGFAERSAQFLSSTPSSAKAVSRLSYGEGTQEPVVTPSESAIPETGSAGRQPKGRSSLASNDTMTPGEKSDYSELSQYKLESEADSTKTPANLSAKTNASLQQGPLSASSTRSETRMSLQEGPLSASRITNETGMSLSQGPLSASRIPSESGLSISEGPLSVSAYSAPRPTTSFVHDRFSGEGTRQGSRGFRPVMEVSQMSEGSVQSNHKSPHQAGTYPDNHQVDPAGWTPQYAQPQSMGIYGMASATSGQVGNTLPSSTGVSQIDYAMEIRLVT